MEHPTPAVAEESRPSPGPLSTSPTPRRVEGTRRLDAPIIVGILSVTLVTLTLIWIVFSLPSRPGRKNVTQEDFCCPNEAARLFSVIERTISPCKDFFAHVCKNAIAEGIVKTSIAKDILEDMKRRIMTGVDLFRSPSAAALYRFYTSCLRELWQEELRYQDITTAILEIGNAKYPISSADLFRFALNVQYRYHLFFFVNVAYDTGKGIEFARHHLSAAPNSLCRDKCSNAALAVLNAHFDTNYTLKQIAEWERHLPGPDMRGAFDKGTVQELQDAFNGLDSRHLKVILQDFAIYLEEGTPIYIRQREITLKEIGILWNTSNQPLSLCHMMLAVAMEAISNIQIYDVLNSSSKKSMIVCQYHGYKFGELWRRTIITALISENEPMRMRNIFEATKHALVAYAPLRKMVAARNDKEKFEAIVRNMSLLLPTDLVLWDLPVPILSTEGFVRNYFRVLSFQFDIRRAMSRRGILDVREDLLRKEDNEIRFVNKAALYVPTIMFSLLSSNTTDPVLADFPVIGTLMAATMWTKVTYDMTWSPQTKQAILKHRSCDTHAQPERNNLKTPDITMLAMGLHLALEAMDALPFLSSTSPTAADWREPKTAWSFNRMSNAEFFYLRYAYFRCDADEHARVLVNAPLKLVPDFISTFGCRAKKSFPNHLGCVNVTEEATAP